MTDVLFKYQKSKWDPKFLKYIGLKCDEKYYKNYIFQCLLKKLEKNYIPQYNRYEIDDELFSFFRDDIKNNKYKYMIYYKYLTKYNLNNFINTLRNNEPDNIVISFDNSGLNIDFLEL